MRALVALILLLPAAVQAGVYRCQDANGQIVISDKPCAPGAKNVEGRYKLGIQDAPAAEDAGARPDLIAEMERRRDFYIGQGYPPDLAAQKALAELAPRAPPAETLSPEVRAQPLPKTGRDNMRDYLEMRERERAAQQQQQQQWLDRSDRLDAERDAEEEQAARDQRRADCEYERRLAALRGGYAYTPGACR
jgi:hypothetical protein